MSLPVLGRLERIELREIWSTEAGDFTPWLAAPENLSALADTLGIDLELEAQEKEVGSFRADLLCKDIGTGTWVLVENQLERTDHTHLGQLLTYASGLEAVTIVWIAGRFTEEHRSTLDWLNKITDESFRFFGLEVELWRIGQSPAAPKFNIVSKPNDWSRSVAQAARAIDEGELSELRVMQQEYWTALQKALAAGSRTVISRRKAPPQAWINFPIGRSNFYLGAVMIRATNQIRAELYIAGRSAKAFFGLLEQQREAIEREMQCALEWEGMPDKQDARISVYMNGADPADRSAWSHQHRWLVDKLNDLHRVFAQRIRSLNSADWQSEPSFDDRVVP